MIKVTGDLIKLEGPGFIIAAEYATLTHALVEKFPDLMDLATKMIIDLSKEAGSDKTDINNN